VSVEERQVERLLALADQQRRLGNWDGAIDALRSVLSIDPHHAIAHAGLAFALLGARRLPGAEIEAELALSCDGDEPYCHLAMAAVLRAARKVDRAWHHCEIALAARPTDVDAHVIAAGIRELQGDVAAARELLQRALELEADDADTLAAFARLELGEGNVEEAARYCDEALVAEPGHLEAHVISGFVALRRGQLADAENHARFALREDPTDRGAIRLWTALKARRSWTLGLWWRFNAWVATRSERGMLLRLLGSFVIARLLIIAAIGADMELLATWLQWAWLGFCVYTWTAPVAFRRMLERDLEDVALRPDY
jgi:tetratricopeptide (TPR) repeat protein